MRGIGVAVSTRRSTGLALARERQPLMHAETMLLVDHGQRQIAKCHVVLEQSVGADDQVDVARRQRGEDFRALAPALAAGEDGKPDAGGRCERRDGRKNAGAPESPSAP